MEALDGLLTYPADAEYRLFCKRHAEQLRKCWAPDETGNPDRPRVLWICPKCVRDLSGLVDDMTVDP